MPECYHTSFGEVRIWPERLEIPLRWKRPRRVFVDSMSDLFHEAVPLEFIARVLSVMYRARRHEFIVLTKRPERMRAYMESFGQADKTAEMFRNVILGVSVEDQASADARIPLLLATPAARRIVSAEPLLGPVDLRGWMHIAWQCSGCRGYFPDPWQETCPACGRTNYWCGSHEFNPPNGQRGSGIDGVIVGGESGPGARPMHPQWARDLRDECNEARVPFYFKQWGGYIPVEQLSCIGINHDAMHRFLDGAEMARVGKHTAGRVLDGRTWDEWPELEL
jgi:protein gp37